MIQACDLELIPGTQTLHCRRDGCRQEHPFTAGFRVVMSCRIPSDDPVPTDLSSAVEFVAPAGKHQAVTTGDWLTYLLGLLKVGADNCCSCKQRANELNLRGSIWCRANRNIIVGWLREVAGHRQAIYTKKFAAWQLSHKAPSGSSQDGPGVPKPAALPIILRIPFPSRIAKLLISVAIFLAELDVLNQWLAADTIVEEHNAKQASV